MSKSVAVLGSLHMDLLVSATRLPTLGETLMGQNWCQAAGGKGLNQSVACARAGANVVMLGAVGGDAFGRSLVEYLRAHEVATDGVATIEHERTGISIVVRTPADYAAVVSSEANASLTSGLIDRWMDVLAQANTLVLQNEIPEEVNVAAAAVVKGRGGRVILNAAPARMLGAEMLNSLSVLIVNAVEAEMMGTASVGDLPSAEAACKQLHHELGCAVVVTAGPHGAAWASEGDGSGCVAGERVDVISSHGAGDTFVGHLVVQMTNDVPLGQAVLAANREAALFVSTPRGTQHYVLS